MIVVLSLALPLLIGAALGLAGGIFGIGGGIIAIPVMTGLFGMDQKLAQGTALVMMVPNLSIALWRYCQRQPLPKLRTALLVLCAVTATALTAHYASSLASSQLRRYFGLFLLWLAIHSLWSLRAGRANWSFALPERLIPLVGLIGGTCQGLISIGGGMITPPILVAFFRQTQAVAQGFAIALVMPSSIVALLTFSNAGLVDWKMGILFALGGALTVSYGVRIAHGLPERRLRMAFALMLTATALWMICLG
ncbi:MAG: sulfite exporter TauE/SafE family protein [Azonexaceae bacterium]|nr:sulfite exporter TauE/SafE family protein [Azonexaceae bacterium]